MDFFDKDFLEKFLEMIQDPRLTQSKKELEVHRSDIMKYQPKEDDLTSPALLKLPLQLIQKIVSDLDPESLISCARTCKLLQAHVKFFETNVEYERLDEEERQLQLQAAVEQHEAWMNGEFIF